MKNIAKGVVSDWDSKNIDDIASDPKLLKDLHEQSKYFKGVSEFFRNLEKKTCDRKYGQRVESRLKGDNKDTGTVVFDEEGFSVKATVRKAVTWEPNTLWEALDQISKEFGTEVAKNISDVTVKIPENKYKDAETKIRLILDDARTVEAKGPDYYISIEEKPHD
jgi:hypothetical protein|tara:strand:+ start:837 stop:1328 length:492 start_codon:yes stop_codon:yes gene_type:complete